MTFSALAAVLVLAMPAAAPAPTATPAPAPTQQDLAREARTAYDRADYRTFLAKTEAAAKLAPNDVWVLYNVACGQAITGKRDEAVRTLEMLADRRVRVDLSAERDFASLRDRPDFRRVEERMKKLADEKISSSTVAFRIPEKGIVPEGIAFDSKTDSFFVSSIRKRKIVRVGRDGRAADFVPSGRDGLRAVLGMRVDPARRRLWACTRSTEHMEGYRADSPGGSSLVEIDADTGALVRERPLPNDPEPSACDDVALAADGSVFVNDTDDTRLYVLRRGASELELFLDEASMGRPQGFAVSDDGKTIWVSNYRSLLAVDTASKTVRPLPAPPEFPLNGIDGLAYAGGTLYAIQNGIEPHRVVRFTLSPDGSRITAGKILEMNNPLFDEPTLGIVAKGAFYYVADSQGGRFLKGKGKVPESEMREVVVLKTPAD
jgi:sugar lactone lactonase YvrE